MAPDDDLDLSHTTGLDEETRVAGLDAWMEVNLGLLKENRRALWNVEAKRDHGENLRDPRADIGDQDRL